MKIVASDVTRRRPVIFSNEEIQDGASILDAVRASTCYPFLFRPFDRNGRCLFVDGGLTSNLPAFLFHQEQRKTRFPVFAFDLVSQDDGRGPDRSLFGYLKDLIGTALDAGDQMIRDVLRDIIHIPIEIPAEPEYEVLNFGMDRETRAKLFDLGYDQTRRRLDEEPIIRNARESVYGLKAVTEIDERMRERVLQKQLWSRFGRPELFGVVLAALARGIEEISQARRVRAHIMLRTGDDATRIVVYSYGMENDEDQTLELPMNAGCSGQAFQQCCPIVADLEKASQTPEDWGMTAEQHARVPARCKSMLSIPLWDYPDVEGDLSEGITVTPLGTLSIDSETPLTDTEWWNPSRGDEQVVQTISLWENVIRRLLP